MRKGFNRAVLATAVYAGLSIALPAALPLTVSGAQAADTPAVPAPRNADGRVLISFAPDQPKGLWVTDYSTGIPFFDVDAIQFKPWAKGLFDARQKHDLEPHARCKVSGAIRQFLTPYGVEILEIAALNRVMIFDIGGPHSYREVFMDGREHPADFAPTNYGHNIGWWESVHVREYLTRVDKNRIDYRFVMEDPMSYDAPIEGQLRLNWREGEELFEFICQQANYAPELMVNEDRQAIGRQSEIVP
jgi:hypothetical protein